MKSLPFNVRERDIDLLLLEQMHISPRFVDWLARKAGLSGVRFAEARHSVYAGNGESDLLLFMTDGADRIVLMIEDKIGAPMQPRQCERYHERGQRLCADGQVKRYQTMLCAPDSYLLGVPVADEWHFRIPLEDIAAWFDQDPSPAANWRAAILRAAGLKMTRARQADDKKNTTYDEQLLAMKKSYYDLVRAKFPGLRVTQQLGRDREYYISAPSLPAGIRFKHAFFRGEVSLIFERKWTEIAVAWLAAHPIDEAALVPHGGELHVRLSTEVLDPAQKLEGQEDTALQALEKISYLTTVAQRVAGFA